MKVDASRFIIRQSVGMSGNLSELNNKLYERFVTFMVCSS